jgi:predicted DNA-binding transcriptional regulator YafY
MRWEKAATLLDLARALAATAEGLTLDEIASRIGATRRTAERMRDALRDLFPALEEVSDGRVKRFRIPNGVDTFFRAPTPEELAELAMAARTLEAQGGEERAALLRGLEVKVQAMLRPRERLRIEPDLDALIRGESLVMQAGPKPMAEPRLLATLREALQSSRFCLFDYAATNGFDYRRRVTPYGILFGRSYYLVGPEQHKDEPVLWRLDRMSKVELGKSSEGIPTTFDLRDYAARSFGAFQEESESIVLRFLPAVAEEARRFDFHPTQVQALQDDGSLIVRFEAGGLVELVRHLFSWGDSVEIIAPDRLKALMIEMLKTALAKHETS